MATLVLAEKPSVARDLAHVLGATSRAEGYLQGNGYVVTWAIGHLVALAEPQEMNRAWKRWSLADLPILPNAWPLVVSESTRAQYAIVRRWLLSSDVDDVVCATDAGREGELIFRYIYESAGASKPVRRLWISSLTPQAIRAGFASLQDGRAFDRLADAARARSRADWLVGMNLTRAYSVLNDDVLSVGRVQTPTLAMIVARELEIRAFVPEHYLVVVATFAPPGEKEPAYEGTYVRPNVRDSEAKRLPIDGEDANEIVERAKRGMARVESVERQSKRIPPPALYDLTELQRHANRLYGYTAQRTLELAQSLYERHKLISYPRTDSRHLSRAIAETLPAIVRVISEPYRALLADGTGTLPLGPRFVDDSRVSDHHAIIPTEVAARADLPPDERRVYDLVCRRLLEAWHTDHVYAVTTVMTEITWNEFKDRYTSAGASVENEGWKSLDIRLANPRAKEPTLPGGLTRGMPRRVLEAKTAAKQTYPPARYTDGTLLTAMETAGRALEEKEMSDAMRQCGLGTPATRSAILETLLRREYIVRDAKTLVATEKGVALVGMVHPHVKSPAMTGDWEAKLARIGRGEVKLGAFMAEIEEYVRGVVGNVGPPPQGPMGLPPMDAPPRSVRSSDLGTLLRDAFGFEAFRPYQEEVCVAAAAGRDVLLVMPTGAGKSLCYQLPGIARGGTTLVISPLIALMEDQVAALKQKGFAAERIHSGRERVESRAVCKAYLEGKLDYLFIAPERLKVPGFPEMLARRKPSLIAIDEAHCISQWGHDFRPDYRMLGERLPLLRPAPVIALTATATPDVQDDIVNELRLTSPLRFIHGFRRTNIAVEAVARNPSERGEVVKTLLQDAGRRPAIVYAPTRKVAEELAKDLSKRHHAAAYHAGLRSAVRDDVQSAFLRGNLDVIVATTAFGMGIDKPNVRTVIHAALPATVEGYYQEIGRAGRDGEPSRAILLYGFIDTKTHEFFLERDYPEAQVLARIQSVLSDQPVSLEALPRRAKVPAEIFEKALEKLWLHGGALIAGDEVRLGGADWRLAYERQIAHKKRQLACMRRFAETPACRMLQLVRHFGDQQDSGSPCGQCDVCAPEHCIAQTFRPPSPIEREAAERILGALRTRDGRAVGQLHKELYGEALSRDAFEQVLSALVRGGSVTLADDEFQKDGETITFQRIRLSSSSPLDANALQFVIVSAPAGKARGKGRRARKPRAERAPREKRQVSDPLEAALRAWRANEAKNKRIPAFRVMNDRTLLGIVTARPKEESELLQVNGIGPGLLNKYGKVILGIVASERST